MRTVAAVVLFLAAWVPLVLASYRADDVELSGLMACYRPEPDRFQVFAMSTNGRLEIVTAQPK